MHTWTANDRVRIHHNGGFGGTIIFADKETGHEVRIESEELLEFIAARYVSRRLEDLVDRAETSELLTLLDPLMRIDVAQRKDG